MRSAVQTVILDGPAIIPGWTPASAGAKLVERWSADVPASLTLSGNLVTTWTGLIAATALTQALAGSKPIYSATGFLGFRPGVTADGIDDNLGKSGVSPLPSGATAGEVYAHVDTPLNSGGTGAASLVVFSWGNTSAASRWVYRSGPTGAGGFLATTTSTAPGLMTGPGHVGGLATGTTLRPFSSYGGPGPEIAVVPATSTSRTRMFSSAAATPANFFPGTAREIVAFTFLTEQERANLFYYFLRMQQQ